MMGLLKSNQLKNFTDKVCVISGAASGIGQALATQLNQQGARLVLLDQNETNLHAAANQLENTVHTATVDVRDRDAIYALAATVKKEFGGASLVINNAGVDLVASVNEMTDDDFNWVMDINFWGMVHGSRAYLDQLLAQPQAALVNISSLFGLIGVPTQSAYNASKFAIRGFTEALRQELLDSTVSVHSVHPGGVRTNIARNARFREGIGSVKSHQGMIDLFERATITSPEKAAKIILRGVSKNNPRILVGPDAVALDLLQRLFPRRYANIVNALMKRA